MEEAVDRVEVFSADEVFAREDETGCCEKTPGVHLAGEVGVLREHGVENANRGLS